MTAVSKQLLEANRLLHQLRQQHQPQQQHGTPASRLRPAAPPPAAQTGPHPPNHHSQPFAAHMQAIATRQARAAARAEALNGHWLKNSTQTTQPTPALHDSPTPSSSLITLHPSLALALLKQDQVAPGRLWLLLRHLDTAGRGWVELSEARRQLTAKDSPLRLCGWRQLRHLLRQGQGLFWERDKSRVWLRSTAKVAAALGITRLSGKPVTLPVAHLCQGIGQARAHLYASFHSSREDEAGNAAPIARDTLVELSGVSRRAQIEYEARAGVRAQANYAIGQPLTPAAAQERAWQKGNAVFEFTDYHGERGEKNARYIAWQLPNSYRGPHHQAPRGRQRQLNQQLADLRLNGGEATSGCPTAGNGRQEDEQRQPPPRRYYQDGRAAVRAHNRQRDPGERLWPDTRHRRFWYVL